MTNLSTERLEEVRQEHETFLSQLEALAVESIALDDWGNFYAHLIDFQIKFDLDRECRVAFEEVSDGVEPSVADLDPTTDNESLGINQL